MRVETWVFGSGTFFFVPLGAVYGLLSGFEPVGFIALLLTGGEDHALAATFPHDAVIPAGWRVIGDVGDASDDAPRVVVDGAAWEGATGWDHFGPEQRGPR